MLRIRYTESSLVAAGSHIWICLIRKFIEKHLSVIIVSVKLLLSSNAPANNSFMKMLLLMQIIQISSEKMFRNHK